MYEEEAFFTTGDKDHLDDEKFFPLWEELLALEVPVVWAIARYDPEPSPSPEADPKDRERPESFSQARMHPQPFWHLHQKPNRAG